MDNDQGWDINERLRFRLPPAEQAAFMASLSQEAKRLLATEGPRAFEASRSAAIAHEIGHVIVGTHEGFTITSVRVFEHEGDWNGMTDDTSGAWEIDATTPTQTVLRRVRHLIAGETAEYLLDPDGYRSGSSLDEVTIARMTINWLVQQRASEFGGFDSSQIYSTCMFEAAAIIDHNKGVARMLMRKLDETGALHGKSLAIHLRRVRTIQDWPQAFKHVERSLAALEAMHETHQKERRNRCT